MCPLALQPFTPSPHSAGKSRALPSAARARGCPQPPPSPPLVNLAFSWLSGRRQGPSCSVCPLGTGHWQVWGPQTLETNLTVNPTTCVTPAEAPVGTCSLTGPSVLLRGPHGRPPGPILVLDVGAAQGATRPAAQTHPRAGRGTTSTVTDWALREELRLRHGPFVSWGRWAQGVAPTHSWKADRMGPAAASGPLGVVTHHHRHPLSTSRCRFGPIRSRLPHFGAFETNLFILSSFRFMFAV